MSETTPVTREASILALIDAICDTRTPAYYTSALLQQIEALPLHTDLAVRELRQVHFALRLVEIGSTLFATSPLMPSIVSAVLPVLEKIMEFDSPAAITASTENALRIIQMCEAAVRNDTIAWAKCFADKTLAASTEPQMQRMKKMVLDCLVEDPLI